MSKQNSSCKNSYMKITKSSICTNLRTLLEQDPQNMLSKIEKNVLNNCSTSCAMKSKELAICKTRHSIGPNKKETQRSITDYMESNVVNLSSYRCYLLEDFVLLKPRLKASIICPTSHLISKYQSLISDGTITFNKQ